LCCDIDPMMMMAQQDTGDEEEDVDQDSKPPSADHEKQTPTSSGSVPQSLLSQSLALPSNGLPNIPPSLTISLTSVPPLQPPNGAHSSARVPALIRMGTKRPSQEGTPPPSGSSSSSSTHRKSVGKKPRFSLDSALLAHVKAEESSYNHSAAPFEENAAEGVGWAFVLEHLQQTKHENEMQNRNLVILLEQQIKLQRQSLKMQKRILSLLEKNEEVVQVPAEEVYYEEGAVPVEQQAEPEQSLEESPSDNPRS
jgi:hypothetical protein